MAAISAKDKVFDILFQEDEITWKDIIHDLIRTERMDPWDVDVSLLAEKFLHTLKEMKQFDFRISGKVVLAAAFFLKIKSDKLLNEDLQFFDDLLNDEPQYLFDDFEDLQFSDSKEEKPVLKYKTPQARKRKVSVYELIDSLEKVLETTAKKNLRSIKQAQKFKAPKKQKDISLVIEEVFEKITQTLEKVKQVTFSQITPSMQREDKVQTFIPLLYLDNQKKIELEQVEHFGEILINLANLEKTYAK